MLKQNIVTRKKKYTKPQLEATEIDYEISLVMMTGPPGGGGDLPPAASEYNTSSQSPVNANAPSYESDPFGGSSPDYSN